MVEPTEETLLHMSGTLQEVQHVSISEDARLDYLRFRIYVPPTPQWHGGDVQFNDFDARWIDPESLRKLEAGEKVNIVMSSNSLRHYPEHEPALLYKISVP